MKRILLILLVCNGLISQAQVYNNEWIDYTKTYYKFQVRPDAVGRGLYRLSQPLLVTAGLNNVEAQHFQLWRDGVQVPIYTTVQTGLMSSGDYIEFWGERNNGKMDKELYRQPEFQLNEKWSLQTDSATYFLTVNTAGPNLRLVPVTNDVAGNTLPVEPYFIHTAGEYYKEKLNSGFAAVVGEYVYSSSYDQGEGWTSVDIGTGITMTNTQANLNVYTGAGAPQPIFRINATGNALNPRNFIVKINGDSVFGKTMDYFEWTRSETPLNLSTISGGTANVEVTNRCLTNNDRMSVAQFEIIYPRTFNFNNARNFHFSLPANAAGNYLEITNFNYNAVQPVLYDLTNGKRYAVNIDNPSLLKIALQPSLVAREMVLVAEDAANAIGVTGLQQRNFIDFSQAVNQGDYIIISHPFLTNGANGTNPVEGYRAYRSSVAGGSYNAKIIMIDQLVDQFGLGVKKHPASIRNFIRWSRSNFASQPRGFFLIGKGVVYPTYRILENEPRIEELNLVPTFGNPGSDNLLSTDPGSQVPVTPIGRLSVVSADEVALYLVKIMQYEQQQAFSSPLIADKAWMKNVVHVVGASDPALQAILDAYMSRYSDVIADTLYGANVHKFSKSSTDAVQQLNNNRVAGLFEEGIGILTYFGHSSATTLEFNLDEPAEYDNLGKYPLFIALGCNAGNFFTYNLQRFTTKSTLSEKFVLAPERGAIAFIASTHFGIVHYLDIMNTRFYEAITDTRYNRNLGEAQIEMIAQVFNLTTQNDYYARFHCEQATIHGDPLLRLSHFTKPDYAIEQQLVKISPTFLTVAEPTFTVDARFINLGKAIPDSMTVEIKRIYPDQTSEVIGRHRVQGTRFIDSLIFNVDIIPTRDKGLNKINITLDADNTADELYETNNTLTKEFFIYEDEARPIYPYNFAIVKDQINKFLASTANPFSESKQYTMELDTTEHFNSPLKVTRSITSSGGILEFAPGMTFTDSTVYYWRVAPVPITGQPVWNKSSFVYLPSHDLGFNQSHVYQHFKSGMQRVHLDSSSRLFGYNNVSTNLFVRNGVFPTACSQASCLSVAVNGDPYVRSVCGQGGIIFHVFDPVTMKPWVNPFPSNPPGSGLYGSDVQCGISRIYNFQYALSDTNKRRKIVELMDLIPDGHYVVVRNISDQFGGGNTYASQWMADTSYLGPGNSMYHRLAEQGFTTIDSFYRPRAFAFVYRKNRQSTFTPAMAFTEGISDGLNLSVNCPTRDTLGYVTSPVLGPALAWKQLKWRGSAEPSGDITKVDVIGITLDGTETVVMSGLTPAQQDVDVSSISALQYPFLKLRMTTQDSINYTPYQLRYWRLTYDPVPEGAIAPNILFETKDVTEVGEPMQFKVAFKNISDVPFDSLKVKMIITDRNNVPNEIQIARKRPLGVTGSPTDTVHIVADINTSILPGLNTITVEANPDNDQLEQYHFNNFAYRSLYVKPDSLNPLLDVTFDGVHILNRDIVSSKPDIIVKMKDEARWMILDDTTLFTLHVKYPNGNLRRMHFDNDTLRFTPAGMAPNADNVATMNFKPYFAEDGEYELIVSGKDKSENTAGNIEYRVAFQVINKPMISNMLNYPNPFTTSTAFVFTITGSEVPQNIKIEIMTITGKIVREITKNELGPLHIGRNITEFKWDGTDQYGSRLANGIYLYRVVTNLNGKELDKYKAEGDNTDKYFNKGYGKMVLMR